MAERLNKVIYTSAYWAGRAATAIALAASMPDDQSTRLMLGVAVDFQCRAEALAQKELTPLSPTDHAAPLDADLSDAACARRSIVFGRSA